MYHVVLWMIGTFISVAPWISSSIPGALSAISGGTVLAQPAGNGKPGSKLTPDSTHSKRHHAPLQRRAATLDDFGTLPTNQIHSIEPITKSTIRYRAFAESLGYETGDCTCKKAFMILMPPGRPPRKGADAISFNEAVSRIFERKDVLDECYAEALEAHRRRGDGEDVAPHYTKEPFLHRFHESVGLLRWLCLCGMLGQAEEDEREAFPRSEKHQGSCYYFSVWYLTNKLGVDILFAAKRPNLARGKGFGSTSTFSSAFSLAAPMKWPHSASALSAAAAASSSLSTSSAAAADAPVAGRSRAARPRLQLGDAGRALGSAVGGVRDAVATGIEHARKLPTLLRQGAIPALGVKRSRGGGSSEPDAPHSFGFLGRIGGRGGAPAAAAGAGAAGGFVPLRGGH